MERPNPPVGALRTLFALFIENIQIDNAEQVRMSQEKCQHGVDKNRVFDWWQVTEEN